MTTDMSPSLEEKREGVRGSSEAAGERGGREGQGQIEGAACARTEQERRVLGQSSVVGEAEGGGGGGGRCARGGWGRITEFGNVPREEDEVDKLGPQSQGLDEPVDVDEVAPRRGD